jgi:NAD(P)-dependent dehydrogenase (short-subunit alcohol dehydrogenase family)
MASLGVCIGIEADLAQEGALDRLASDLSEITPALQILVNNAGTTWGASLETFPDHAWPSVMDLNVRVPFATVQRLLPLLEAGGTLSDPARVINIGSVAGVFSAGLKAYSYSASKAALHHLGRELATELGPRGIAVNTIVPGFFPTRMTAHLPAEEATIAATESAIPLRRFGAPDDIAGLCVFLSSAAAAYINGAQIVLDGGLAAAH